MDSGLDTVPAYVDWRACKVRLIRWAGLADYKVRLRLPPLETSAKRDTFKGFCKWAPRIDSNNRDPTKFYPLVLYAWQQGVQKSLDFSLSQNVEFRPFFRLWTRGVFGFIIFIHIHFPSFELCLEDAILSVVFNCLENSNFLFVLKFAKQKDVHVTDIFGLCKLS